MQYDEALGFAINQHMFAERITNIELGEALGISKSTTSRKVRGHVTWSAQEVSLAATLFGVSVDALMPTPDGAGGCPPRTCPLERLRCDETRPLLGPGLWW